MRARRAAARARRPPRVDRPSAPRFYGLPRWAARSQHDDAPEGCQLLSSTPHWRCARVPQAARDDDAVGNPTRERAMSSVMASIRLTWLLLGLWGKGTPAAADELEQGLQRWLDTRGDSGA